MPGPYDSIDWFLRRTAALPASEKPERFVIADEAHGGLIRERIKALGLEAALGAIPFVTYDEHRIASGRGDVTAQTRTEPKGLRAQHR